MHSLVSSSDRVDTLFRVLANNGFAGNFNSLAILPKARSHQFYANG